MDIEQRLTRLERQNRIYRGLFVLAGVMLAALLTYGAAKPIPEVIRARRFEAVDARGVGVAAMLSSDQGGWLEIKNNKGNPTFFTSQSDSGSGVLGLYNSKGARIITLEATARLHGSLRIKTSNGNDGIVMQGQNSDGTGGILNLYNKTGERVAQILADEYGDGLVGAYDRRGRGRTLQPGP